MEESKHKSPKDVETNWKEYAEFYKKINPDSDKEEELLFQQHFIETLNKERELMIKLAEKIVPKEKFNQWNEYSEGLNLKLDVYNKSVDEVLLEITGEIFDY
jgi:hypothetical protein